MVKGLRQRTLEKLAYRYSEKNPKRSEKENWALAEKFLQRIDKRYKIDKRD